MQDFLTWLIRPHSFLQICMKCTLGRCGSTLATRFAVRLRRTRLSLAANKVENSCHQGASCRAFATYKNHRRVIMIYAQVIRVPTRLSDFLFDVIVNFGHVLDIPLRTRLSLPWREWRLFGQVEHSTTATTLNFLEGKICATIINRLGTHYQLY